MSEAKLQNSSSYTERLRQSIPSEFIAAYLAIYNLIIPNIKEQGKQVEVLIWCAVILLISLPFYIYGAQGVRSVRVILVSCVSFCIWIVSLGGILNHKPWYLPVYSSIAIIWWTLISPILIPKQKEV